MTTSMLSAYLGFVSSILEGPATIPDGWVILDGFDNFIHPDPFPSQGKWKRVGKKRMRGKLPRKKKKDLYGTRRSRARFYKTCEEI